MDMASLWKRKRQLVRFNCDSSGSYKADEDLSSVKDPKGECWQGVESLHYPCCSLVSQKWNCPFIQPWCLGKRRLLECSCECQRSFLSGAGLQSFRVCFVTPPSYFLSFFWLSQCWYILGHFTRPSCTTRIQAFMCMMRLSCLLSPYYKLYVHAALKIQVPFCTCSVQFLCTVWTIVSGK